MKVAWLGVGLSFLAASAAQRATVIKDVQSGHAELHQRGRLTILDLASPGGSHHRVVLTYPRDSLHVTIAPYEARLIAESPNHFLIFTDTFQSNPFNIQGQCGASETGERFVHVVALGETSHETFSVLVESCLLDVEPVEGAPEWLAKRGSAGLFGELVLRFKPGNQPPATYYVSPDGAVRGPEARTEP